MNENLESESLLVLDKADGNKVKAVSGMDSNGQPKTVPPTKENEPDFLKIDKNGNALENFFTNFKRQFKDPTRFDFFLVRTSVVENIASVMESMANGQNYAASDEMLKEYSISPDDYAKNQQSKEQGYKPIDESRIDWDSLKQFGVTRESLVAANCLEPMLNYQKSPVLFPVSGSTNNVKMNVDARLQFRENPDGRITLDMHGVHNEVDFKKPFYGYTFNEEDKNNLLQRGNLGKVINLKIGNSPDTIPAYVSVDRLTNDLVALRADRVKIPEEIKGVKLDEMQKMFLKEGKAIYLEGMTSKSGKEFNATVQVNADKRGIEFIFNNTPKQSQNVSNEKSQGGQKPRESNLDENGNVRIPTNLGRVVLTPKEQSTLREGGTIYVKGMVDKKGQQYNAYVKVNNKEGKLDFFQWNPDKKQDVTPDNAARVQVAVNSEGKTNEATKHSADPLKPGQTQASEKQEERKQEERKRSTGRKM